MSRVFEHMPGMTLRRTRMTPRRVKLAIVLSGFLLGGCASFQRDHVIVGSVPSDYRTLHPIVVSESAITEDLVVSQSMRNMSYRQENLVLDFSGRFKRSGARSITLLLPSGSPNEAAAQRIASEVVDYLEHQGVRRNRISIATYLAERHGDAATIRLSFNAMTANVASECGQWNEDLIRTTDNRNYKNFGCATQNNLAKIIANPEDLLGPRGESEIDATRRDNVIGDWRDSGSAPLPSLL